MSSVLDPLKACLAFCALAGHIATAVAAPTALGLSRAQQLAVERSPQIAAYDAAITAARRLAAPPVQPFHETRQTGIAPLPVQGADALSYGREANPLRRLDAARDVSGPEQREALAQRYAREADRAAAEKSAMIVDTARDAALAWLDCYYAEKMSRVADEAVKAAQVELEGAGSVYWAGRASQADFYAARSVLVMLEDKSSEVGHSVRAARIALKRWVGDAGDAPLDALPNIDRIRLRAGALEGDLARQPDVALLEKHEDLAASDVRLAQANGQPEGEIAVMVVRRDEAHAAREEKLRAKVAELRIMIDQWQHARDRRNRYANELVPLARERTLATLVAYRGGKAALTDVLGARRAESEAQMQSIERERETARLWARLEFSLPETSPTTQTGSLREENPR